jgi:acyl-coenzyme A thioesterase PaaI-like protein
MIDVYVNVNSDKRLDPQAMPHGPPATNRRPGFAERVRASFERQGMMAPSAPAAARRARPSVEIQLPYAAHLTQQHGFLHGGIMGAALDSACGYAGLHADAAPTRRADHRIQDQLRRAGQGPALPHGRHVVKPGRTITVVEGRAFAVDDGREKLVATMSTTLMAIAGRDLDIKHSRRPPWTCPA